jgi:DNA-binding transcriptional ArsR family regulator
MSVEQLAIVERTVNRKVQKSLNIEIPAWLSYINRMTIEHPDTEEIDLADVLTALGDGTRLAMIGQLATSREQELMCSQFLGLGSKTVLSYHLAKLREAGVVKVRPEGTKRLISLRRADLNQRFPGFLDAILTSAIPIATRAGPGAEAGASPVATEA